jgi:hypothetical protein
VTLARQAPLKARLPATAEIRRDIAQLTKMRIHAASVKF